MAKVKTAVLISGRGSNLKALIEACAKPSFPAEIVLVLSNKVDAPGLAIATEAGLKVRVVEHTAYSTREAFEEDLDKTLKAAGAEIVCLAGFMRVLTASFVKRWEDRIINIHPSLLPAFTGVNTHQRAIDEGVRLHGCTVHFVTEALDHGPIVVQAAVPVLPEDDEATLAARVLEQEHRIYPMAVRWFLENRIVLDDGRVRLGNALYYPDAVISPDDRN